MFKKYITLILFVLLISFTNDVIAQGGGNGPPCGSPPCGPPPPPNTPIDGGLGALLILGIGYAVKKLRNKE